ncbi:hypothetical protein P280DRAFT_482690 [Massarina eburnea CBS 473.64]|uniref:F-box domain-containing protein n=1 Tax=Massarina eburnea CBS 473.64 TaxID=1395130 RepID=A0A6A6RSZ6_9PLEO|nr:hypothetical protein P280DRAFT_482690 [Massarina eburnea CBS 473.64]
MAMSNFRLMDLPKELRLLVYESIPPTTQLWAYPNATQHSLFKSPFPSAHGTIILVVQQVSNAILATCRQVYDEAHTTITRKRREEVQLDIPRVIIDLAILHVLPQNGGLFAKTTKLREILLNETSQNILGSGGSSPSKDSRETLARDDPSLTVPTNSDRLSTFVGLCAKSLQSNPAFVVDIGIFGRLATVSDLSTQLTRLCGLSGGHFQNLDITVGVADPRFFPSAEEHRMWEERLLDVMKEMEKYMEDVVEFLEITSVHIKRAERETEQDWEERSGELDGDVGIEVDFGR